MPPTTTSGGQELHRAQRRPHFKFNEAAVLKMKKLDVAEIRRAAA